MKRNGLLGIVLVTITSTLCFGLGHKTKAPLDQPEKLFGDSRVIDAAGNQIIYGPDSASYYCKYFSRKKFDQDSLECLAESIRELGEIIDPLTVEYDEQEDIFRIIAIQIFYNFIIRLGNVFVRHNDDIVIRHYYPLIYDKSWS